jgi:hypothetical protein
VVKTPPGIDNREFLLERKISSIKDKISNSNLTLIHYTSLSENKEQEIKQYLPKI